jgi:hypothetical protein
VTGGLQGAALRELGEVPAGFFFGIVLEFLHARSCEDFNRLFRTSYELPALRRRSETKPDPLPDIDWLAREGSLTTREEAG